MNKSNALILATFVLVVAIILWFYFGGDLAQNHSSQQQSSQQKETLKTQNTSPSTNSPDSRLPKSLDASIENDIRRFARKDTEGLIQEETKDSGTKVHLKGRYLTVPVATIGPNGEIIIQERSVTKSKNNSKTIDKTE